jgi:hypothetical protein
LTGACGRFRRKTYIPAIGLGMFQMPPDVTTDPVAEDLLAERQADGKDR